MAMNVVVTAGGTMAPIDDVRHIANASTGRFGAMIAEAALARGARVWHLHAPGALRPFDRLAKFDLETPEPSAEFKRLQELRDCWLEVRDRCQSVPLAEGTVAEYSATLERLLREHSIDVAFLAMAASDFAPVPHSGKVSSDSETLDLRCRRLPKVIESVRDWSPSTYLVGFKLLSNATEAELIRRAEQAGQVNRADLTVANDLRTVREGRHVIHLVRVGRPTETFGPDDSIADRLVERAFAWASARGRGR
ncbi:phosphopantothenoylcysteine decarboxylase [Tundrisphaera lichenicola]|uniref:phosphopantothenoylcysteine decarboxylase domain-containing protein n=1 Tax=Tundrisphaera lichenicola TaxID=2029860 RepID=UPI003EB7F34C